MKEVKIERNQVVSKWDEEMRSKAMISAVEDVLGFSPDWEEYASRSIYDVMKELGSERQIRDVALLCFSSDWNFSVEALKGCKIVVDGYCPLCGDRLEMHYGERLYDYTLGCMVSDTEDYLECPSCNYFEE